MTMALVPLNGGRPVPLDKAIVFFGRGPDCDVVLNTSRKVSRKHCCIAQIDDYFVVRDLGSMNGLRVNDRIVNGEMRLNVGEELWVGDLGFRLQPLGSSSGIDSASPSKGAPAKRTAPPRDGAPQALPEESVDFRIEESAANDAIPPPQLRDLFDSDG